MTTDITELAQKPTRYGTNSQGVFTNQADGAYVSYQDFLVVVEALEQARRANAAQDDHINQQQDRIEALEKKNTSLGKHVIKLESRVSREVQITEEVRNLGLKLEAK
ncbi:hypothetical protein KLVA111870_02020 [Klebsiella variicola]|uniref:hypothetical protein n=1 Tax=Klebsiella variicola TaxID=244366 RepID=UPI00109BB27E|nr:hypothetical protein [Klebsiella variicola]VGP71465.1 hypothetical protein SB5387_01050 [Klebsiella variicola]